LSVPALLATSRLCGNYPNPFNPQTTIAYQLPQAGPVRLTLYNVAGQVVRRLVDQEQAAGRYHVVWDGKDDQGRDMVSGVYLYRMQAAPFQQTRRLVLVK
jgi:flagellar hook assembly protein FlgD